MSDLLNDMNTGVVPFTRIPNYFFDEYYFLLSESALKVYMAIARKTIGWRKNRDCISYSQLKNLSRLSETSISKGIKELLKNGLIEILKEGRGKGEKVSYGLIDKSLPQNKTDSAPNSNEPLLKNAPNFEINRASNASKFGDTERNIIIKKEEVKKATACYSKDNNAINSSELSDKLASFGLSISQTNAILKNYADFYIREKTEQFEYLLESYPQKMKGTSRYLYNSIVNDWKDDLYTAYKSNMSKKQGNKANNDIILKERYVEKIKQEYNAYLEKLAVDCLNSILPNELKELDIILESEMSSDFYKSYEKGGKIYNNLLNIKRIEYIKREYLKALSLEEFVAQKKEELAA